MILAGIAALLLSHQETFPKDTAKGIIEDFESGSFANWKITGSFGRANLPTNAAEFNIRYKSTPIANFEGKYFALSLDRSNSETGKAVSPSFEIPKDWTQISFDILGGNDPTKTAFRLIRDDNGGVVRTASGDGTLTFVHKSWNVADLRGKFVHLEIEDSATGLYGFIGLDHVTWNAITTTTRVIYEPLWSPSNLGKGFLSSSKPILQQFSSLDFGVTSRQFETLVNHIYLEMCSGDMDHIKGRSTVDTAALIKSKVDLVVDKSGLRLNELGKEWILAEGVGAWVRIHVKDWIELRQPGAVKEEYINSTYMLNMDVPKGVCSGFSVMVRDLSRSVGLTCHNVIGVFKDYGGPTSTKDNHEWNCFIFSGGIRSTLDASQTRVSKEQIIERNGKIYREWVLPKTPAEFELFLCTKFGRATRDNADIAQIEFNRVPFSEWSNTDTKSWLQLKNDYRRWETNFNRSVR